MTLELLNPLRKDEEQQNPEPPQYDVCIIGAGISGLAAAEALNKKGFRTIILEARDRIGGRIDSREIGGRNGVKKGRVDMGANAVHGKYDNPIHDLYQNLGIELHYPTDGIGKTRFVQADGTVLDDETSAQLVANAETTFFDASRGYARNHDPAPTASIASFAFSSLSTLYNGLSLADPKARYHAASVARSFDTWTGADLEDVSLRWWGFERDTVGPDGVVRMGKYHELCDHVAKQAGPILLNQKVTGLKMVHDEVQVNYQSTKDVKEITRAVTASYVICTLPLGVLQKAPPTFEPPLPPRKVRSIRALGMGLLSKVALRYDRAWWRDADSVENFFILPDPQDPLAVVPPGIAPSTRPRAIVIENFQAIDGTPQLVVYLAASFAVAMESSVNASKWAHDLVTRFLKPQEEPYGIPDISHAHIISTSWQNDPYSYGSYMYLPSHLDEKDGLAVTPLDIAEFTVPVWDGKLGFAGEHTHQQRYASVHGALESGRREALRVAIELQRRELAE